mmetsp:Transcript_120648/g.257691  ORF Transcript_120648/g.257691 Transcript_120648/m.257691 type:complete len:230 (-) Transcript_120648:165-854(-)
MRTSARPSAVKHLRTTPFCPLSSLPAADVSPATSMTSPGLKGAPASTGPSLSTFMSTRAKRSFSEARSLASFSSFSAWSLAFCSSVSPAMTIFLRLAGFKVACLTLFPGPPNSHLILTRSGGVSKSSTTSAIFPLSSLPWTDPRPPISTWSPGLNIAAASISACLSASPKPRSSTFLPDCTWCSLKFSGLTVTFFSTPIRTSKRPVSGIFLVAIPFCPFSCLPLSDVKP